MDLRAQEAQNRHTKARVCEFPSSGFSLFHDKFALVSRCMRDNHESATSYSHSIVEVFLHAGNRQQERPQSANVAEPRVVLMCISNSSPLHREATQPKLKAKQALQDLSAFARSPGKILGTFNFQCIGLAGRLCNTKQQFTTLSNAGVSSKEQPHDPNPTQSAGQADRPHEAQMAGTNLPIHTARCISSLRNLSCTPRTQ